MATETVNYSTLRASPAALARLAEALEPGEQVIWAARPGFFRANLLAIVQAVHVLLIQGSLLWTLIGFGGWRLLWLVWTSPMVWVSNAFFLAWLALLARALSRHSSRILAITSQRAIAIEPRFILPGLNLASYGPDELSARIVSRRKTGDGTLLIPCFNAHGGRPGSGRLHWRLAGIDVVETLLNRLVETASNEADAPVVEATSETAPEAPRPTTQPSAAPERLRRHLHDDEAILWSRIDDPSTARPARRRRALLVLAAILLTAMIYGITIFSTGRLDRDSWLVEIGLISLSFVFVLGDRLFQRHGERRSVHAVTDRRCLSARFPLLGETHLDCLAGASIAMVEIGHDVDGLKDVFVIPASGDVNFLISGLTQPNPAANAVRRLAARREQLRRRAAEELAELAKQPPGNLDVLSPSQAALIDRELEEGETVLWAGRPKVGSFFATWLIGSLALGNLILLVGIPSCLSQEVGRWIAVWCAIGVTTAMLLMTALLTWRSARTRCLITDRRFIRLTGVGSGDPAMKARRADEVGLLSVLIGRKGGGTLRIAAESSPLGRVSRYFEFTHLPDPAAAAAIAEIVVAAAARIP